MKHIFKKDFLSEQSSSPHFAVISFVFVTFFLGFALSISDYRYGLQTHEMELEAPTKPEGFTPFWFAVSLDGPNRLKVITQQRQVFSLPIRLDKLSDLQDFEQYLHQRVKYVIERSVLQGEAINLHAVLAVDEGLRFSHLKPILYALSQAHIDRYGFETKIRKSL